MMFQNESFEPIMGKFETVENHYHCTNIGKCFMNGHLFLSFLHLFDKLHKAYVVFILQQWEVSLMKGRLENTQQAIVEERAKLMQGESKYM